MIDLSTLSDQDLLVRFVRVDMELGDSDVDPRPVEQAEAESATLEAEVTRRFGQDALNNLENWWTPSHASHEDVLQMAREETGRLVELLRGHNCDNQSVSQTTGVCWCGRVWAKTSSGKTWYDPTEGDDPSIASDTGDGEAAPELTEALAEAEARAQMAWADRQFYGHA